PAPERVERFLREPPDDTRAYLRAHVLRRFGDHVSSMDWDRIRFRLQTDRYWWSETALPLLDPTAYGRAESEPILQRCQTLTELVAALGVEANPGYGSSYGRPVSEGRDVRGERSDGWPGKSPRRIGYYR